MKANEGARWRWPVLLAGVICMGLLPAVAVPAQESDGAYRAAESARDQAAAPDQDGAYRAAENSRIERDASGHTLGPSDPIDLSPPADGQNTGPVRLARFSYVSGNVSWRADDSGEWSRATVNLPIREGAQIWVTEGGHADIQFDDGSELRLGNGALATLKVLYSDKEGEFTQISLNDGLATLHSRHDNGVFQIDTPAASVKSKGASQIRFGVDNGSEVSVQHGDATIEGPQGSVNLHAGDYLYLEDANSPFDVRKAPSPDSWDRWNDERNRILEGKVDRNVPPNIGLVAGELDDYGTWRTDPSYGPVWCPRVTSIGWRPYYDGHWTWIDPFGWTWVSNEPWGWAPYHYGTWVHASYGWGWCPGPVHQYWSPAVVHFSVYDGNVAWAPLCPWEVHYPAAVSFGYWGPSWAFSFSIGSAGVYYPAGGYCVGRPWNNFYVNRFNHFHGAGSPSFDRFARSSEFAAANGRFVPYNASRVSGASFARIDAFGGHGRYEPLSTANAGFFTRGRYAAAPGAGRTPVAGPPSVTPTALARTPTRTYLAGIQPSQTALKRNLYHAPTPIARRGGDGLAPGASILGNGSAATGRRQPVIGANGSAGTVPGARGPVASGRINPAMGGRQPGGTAYTPSVGTPTARNGAAPDNTTGRNRVPLVNREPTSREPASSAAEAARRARSSLGMGGGRTPSEYGGTARSGSGSVGRTGGAVLNDRGGRGDSGVGRTPSSSGRGSSGDTYNPAGRVPRSGGSPGRTNTDGGSGSSGRVPDATNRSTGPRSYGGSSEGSPRAGGSGYGGGTYRTPGGDSGYSGEYRSGRSRSYGSSDSGTGRSGGYGTGGYSSGRSGGYGSDGYAPGRSRSYGSGESGAGRSGTYSPGRSGSYGTGGYSGGGRSEGYSGGRSGASSANGGSPAGRTYGGSTGSEGGRSSSGGGRSGGDSGRSGGESSRSGGDGGRSGGDSGGGYSSGRSRGGR